VRALHANAQIHILKRSHAGQLWRPWEMEEGMGKLILVRHGHTSFNGGRKASKRLRGWIDVPLGEQGRDEARIVGEWVGANHEVEAIYTSDLVRARQLAAEVEKSTGVASFVSPNLRPWNVGRLAGRRVAEILDTHEILNQNPDITAGSARVAGLSTLSRGPKPGMSRAWPIRLWDQLLYGLLNLFDDLVLVAFCMAPLALLRS
jgi:hypothetical protein